MTGRKARRLRRRVNRAARVMARIGAGRSLGRRAAWAREWMDAHGERDAEKIADAFVNVCERRKYVRGTP